MADVDAVLDDLHAEGDELDALVAALSDDQWRLPTSAPGWDVAHQIAHLAWTDEVAECSATNPAEFAKLLEHAGRNPHTFVDTAAATRARVRPSALLADWRAGRARLLEALRTAPAGHKIAWFGPPMSVASMATARIMENWAHGQDVADALSMVRTPTPRLRNVAHIGVRTRDFAYTLHGQSPPEEQFRVVLTGPQGQRWTWGPEDASQHVTGPALDFCLLVTQRRHLDDLQLATAGDDAAHWLSIAQAFAGPPGQGRKAGQFG